MRFEFCSDNYGEELSLKNCLIFKKKSHNFSIENLSYFQLFKLGWSWKKASSIALLNNYHVCNGFSNISASSRANNISRYIVDLNQCHHLVAPHREKYSWNSHNEWIATSFISSCTSLWFATSPTENCIHCQQNNFMKNKYLYTIYIFCLGDSVSAERESFECVHRSFFIVNIQMVIANGNNDR